MPSIEMSLTALRAVMFGAEELENIHPQSCHLGDTAKIKIIPRSIAEVILDCDPEQEIYHVELYPTHGEIWLAFEWRESNARLERMRTHSEVTRKSYDVHKARLAEVTAHITTKFEISGVKLDSSYINFLANQILAKGLSGKAAFIVDLLEIHELIAKYEKTTQDPKTDQTKESVNSAESRESGATDDAGGPRQGQAS